MSRWIAPICPLNDRILRSHRGMSRYGESCIATGINFFYSNCSRDYVRWTLPIDVCINGGNYLHSIMRPACFYMGTKLFWQTDARVQRVTYQADHLITPFLYVRWFLRCAQPAILSKSLNWKGKFKFQTGLGTYRLIRAFRRAPTKNASLRMGTWLHSVRQSQITSKKRFSILIRSVDTMRPYLYFVPTATFHVTDNIRWSYEVGRKRRDTAGRGTHNRLPPRGPPS